MRTNQFTTAKLQTTAELTQHQLKCFTHTGIDTADKLNPLVTHNYKNRKFFDPVSHFCSILNSDLVVSHNQPRNSFLIKCPY